MNSYLGKDKSFLIFIIFRNSINEGDNNMILLKVNIYNNRLILIPNCGVLNSVIALVRSLSNPVIFIVLGLDLLISIQHQAYNGK